MQQVMSDDVAAHNRAHWTALNASYDQAADRAWAADEIGWGVFDFPERELRALGDVRGLSVIELGCGTAYFSAWLKRRGAHPVGLDVTPAQLASAHRRQRAFGLEFPLIEASAERVPLPDASFDLALSEYGACLWCEPAAWLAEAARLLRPDGRLVFLTTSLLATLCAPEGPGQALETLQRSQADCRRIAWPEGGIEYHLGHGEWIDLLARHGFALERMVELYAPERTTADSAHGIASAAWARRWPIEEVWMAKKRGG